jgi:hypothetical protein
MVSFTAVLLSSALALAQPQPSEVDLAQVASKPPPAPAFAPPVPGGSPAPAGQPPGWKGFTFGELSLRPYGNFRARVNAGPEQDYVGIYTGRFPMSLIQTHLGVSATVRAWSFGVELHDGRELLTDEALRTQQFPADLHQLFLQYRLPAGPGPKGTFRLGRQIISFGSARLMSPLRWSNLQPNFDGGRALLEFGTLRLDAFVARPVVKRGQEWDLGSGAYVSREYLWGLVGTRPMLPWLAAEAYVLGLVNGRTVGTVQQGHRVTPGVRMFGKLPESRLGYEVEAALQLGSTGERSILAHAVHAEVSCGCPGPMAPLVKLEGNLASGDADRTDGVSRTFVPLFGKGHRPYGAMDLFWWQNMRELALGVTFSPHRTVKITPEYHLFWLDQAADDWVAANGRPLRQAARPEQGELAAQELDLVVIWTPSPHLQLELAGGYMPDSGRQGPTGATGAAWRTYAQTVLQF